MTLSLPYRAPIWEAKASSGRGTSAWQALRGASVNVSPAVVVGRALTP
ncbi:hypothetical protein CGMCC3_g10940 [Colletotrichum fructicola]|nr:uncharacterized protein CGMCC3_g10940 [Colletotrichum fructicola]KAE9573078.1 hypothetical protein CGMCC3_g10940 [Colletotrichum fructicola]